MIDASGIQITIPAAAAGGIIFYATKIAVEWFFQKSGYKKENGTCKASSIVIPVMDVHKNVLNEIKQSNGEIRDSVRELVTLQKFAPRR